MARAEIEPEHGGRLALGLVVAGLVCAARFLQFGHVGVVRGAFGSLGINTGAIGVRIAAWFSIHLHDRRGDLAAAPSVPFGPVLGLGACPGHLELGARWDGGDAMPRFVLLEHRWNGVHWDLMFEVGDVLRTWAIDAPIVPGADLPARALGDHRRVYLEYEGEISGNRGTVRRVDQGRYTPEIWDEDQVRVLLEGTQLVGAAELRRIGSGTAETPSLTWSFRLGKRD